MQSNNKLKNFQETFWNLCTIRSLKGHLQKTIFFSCSPTQLWSFPCRLCWKRLKPVVAERFEFVNRDKAIWNAFTLCFALWNFQCWDQKFWFSTAMLIYKCEVSNCVFLQTRKNQPVVTEKYAFRYRVETISKPVLDFPQSVFCCINYKLCFFFLVLKHNTEVSDEDLVAKNHFFVTGKFSF